MAHAYLEEQIAGIALMCEALICNLHWSDEEGHPPAPGHNAYPASGCEHRTCRKYQEGFHMKTFGYILPSLQELKAEVEKLKMENDLLKTQVNQ